MTAVAGSAIAVGAALSGLAAGAATAAPFDPTTLPSCAAFINPDGTTKSIADACRPVDVFTAPGLTLAQRIALVNPQSPLHDQLVHQLKDKFGK